MALVRRSEPKIRLGIRVSDFAVVCLLAIITKKRWGTTWDPPKMVESGKRLLSSQFLQVFDTPTNFHRPSTSRSTELAKALDPPNSPQRERIQSGYVDQVSTTFAYSTHQVSSRSIHPKRLPRFLVSLSTPPNVTRSSRDLKYEL